MKSTAAVVVFAVTVTVLSSETKRRISPVVIPGNGSSICTLEQKQHGLQSIRELVNASMSNIHSLSHCGDGLWYQVACLNMSDSSQSCPSSWREYRTAGVRACGRFDVGCAGKTYSTGRVYSKVCGRIIGYQVASPDAFNVNIQHPLNANQMYADGISITYGPLRTHLWTYVAGVSEGTHQFPRADCPCAVNNASLRRPAPAFIGNNYYCESGNRVISGFDFAGYVYVHDPIWDGLLCEAQCCSNGKSPPWFSVELSSPTSDDIEVRICGDQTVCDEDTPISLMEIYVQ